MGIPYLVSVSEGIRGRSMGQIPTLDYRSPLFVRACQNRGGLRLGASCFVPFVAYLYPPLCFPSVDLG